MATETRVVTVTGFQFDDLGKEELLVLETSEAREYGVGSPDDVLRELLIGKTVVVRTTEGEELSRIVGFGFPEA